jgi:uncharacterized protein (DUF1778 family)
MISGQRTRGRPPEGTESRLQTMRVRISDKERVLLEQAAAQKGYPDLSHYVRATLLEHRRDAM